MMRLQSNRLFATLVTLAIYGTAYGENYTRCYIPVPDANSAEYCLPETNGTTPISLQFVRRNSLDNIVGVVPMKNCRTKTNNVRGGLSLVIDNSESRKKSDPSNGRIDVAEDLLNAILDNATSQANLGTLPTTHADFPKVGIVAYGGKQGTATGAYEADGINRQFTKEFCNRAEAGGTVGAFPTGKERWAQTSSSGAFYSVCDYLSPVGANVQGSANSSTPSMTRNIEFLNYTSLNPRGSTDLTYMLEAIQNDNMLGTLTTNAKNAIVISDGLPTSPKRIAAEVCDQTPHLKDETQNPRGTDANAPDPTKRFCVDRQFRLAASAANEYIEGNARFNEINVYHVLYLGEGKAFIDVDSEGELNPADFLIENSARTGNGKVKFKYARGADALKNYVTSVLEHTSPEAVQRVEIKVNNNPTYNAVSTPDFDKLFSLKFINLQLGSNTVTVTVVYTDKKVSQTYNVTVADSGDASPADYRCEPADGTLTVDGDDPTSRTPSGDGVLPFPKDDGSQDRVPRNADPENSYNAADFEGGIAPTPAPDLVDGMRIQGGMGNCGVIAGAANSVSAKAVALLLILPLIAAGLIRKKKKKTSGIVTRLFQLMFGLIGASLFNQSAQAAGLNVENFVPASGAESGLLWEKPESIAPEQLIMGYTFDYAFRPIEFGDGSSKRIAISDHLQVNHLSAGYGVMRNIDLGLNVPVALYSNPKDSRGALALGSRDRNSFFLSDAHLRVKFSPDALKVDGFAMALVSGITLPTGNSTALLSDDALKLALSLPMSYGLSEDTRMFFTPGIVWYSSNERIMASEAAGGEPVLTKSRALLMNVGLQHWLSERNSMGEGLLLEAGIRADFADFTPSLNTRGSPVEWAAGAAWYLSERLSAHGSYGTGLGSGVGAPASRLVAGVRYSFDTKPDLESIDETSESFSERELDEILAQAQKEDLPPRYSEDETLLKLLYGDQILDLGSVRFEFNSARLTAEAKRTVLQLYDMLIQIKAKSVRIEGHTDSIGSFKYNLALSKRRAESVKAELVRLGFKHSIATEGMAFKFPIESNATKSGRAANRRIEVTVDGQSFSRPKVSNELLREWIYPNGRKPSRQEELDSE